MHKRITCVLIPKFPLVVQSKDHPELITKPVILVDSPGTRSKVLYSNTLAEREGVSLGMTAVQARNVCPELCILIRNAATEQRRFYDLLRKLQSFSPFVEGVGSGIVYLDASGLKRTYPQERDLAEKLVEFVKNLGYPVKVGIAANKFTSLVCASISEVNSYTVVPDGKEKEFLSSQPIQLLPMEQDQYEKLYRLGIKTMGQFALLPDQEVAERFGSEGINLLELARGKDNDPLKPIFFDEKETKKLDLSSPLETSVGILFFVNSILEQQLGSLVQKGLACEEILVILKTDDNNEIPVHLSVVQGTIKARAFIDLLRLELERIILPSAVKEIRVCIQRTSPLSPEQLSLYHKKDNNPLNQKLTQLKRILGDENILSPQIVSSHKPENKFRLVAYAPQKDNAKQTRNRKSDKVILNDKPESASVFFENSILSLRLYNPPKPATVRKENGSIRFIIADSWYGEVIKQRGPWEISGEWWSDGYNRDYFEVELSEGEQYLLFLENTSQKWFLQGVFD